MPPAPPARLAPWTPVVSVGLLASALLVTGWTTYAGVREASSTLVRGQADALERAIRWQLIPAEGRVSQEQLQELLDEEAAAGLRYLAIVERGGTLVAQAGAPSALPATGLPELRPGELSTLDSRIRTAFRLQPRRGPFGPSYGRPSLAVVEFEPVQAQALRANAARTFGVGALAAFALLVSCGALVRRALRRGVEQAQREHERRLASIGEMSAVLAHELRNPLASLKGNAQLLAQMLTGTEKPRQKADRVVEEAVRLETLTNGLLEYVRTGELQRAPVDPARLLRECVAQLEGSSAQVDDAGAPPTWPLDAERMRQVLMNLLQNAEQAGAPVKAAVRQGPEGLVFEVRDSGPGIPPEDRERVFEPFFTKRTKGTGLGLAVVRRVVEQHGGRIVVQSAEGGGALFRVVLPSV